MVKRIISAFLTVLMVVGAVSLAGFASMSTASASYEDKVDENGDPIINYITYNYSSPEEKLRDMTLMKEQDGYQIYVEEFTGEIAFINTKTGESLFSNPYDVSSSYNWASASTKRKLLSQLAVTYEDNGVESTMYSYEEAALRGQIAVKNIKNGVRVEYTVGELATTRLVPRMISKTRFETMILANITNDMNLKKLTSFYTLYDTSDTSLTERNVKEIQAAFPITKKFAVYVCDPDIAAKQLRTLETIIKTYCPNYTYEEMDQDHADCDYTSTDEAPANFKMALEYTITEDGLEARLPANGIRFDESNFTLKSISVLPYMGCGSSQNKGYTFFPDGSGTLIRFEDVAGSTYNVSGQMYGADYAYHTISGQHSETMRLPVFGVVENVEGSTEDTSSSSIGRLPTAQTSSAAHDRGYLAIITEGDSMATLMSEHGGQLHCYNNVYASFSPRSSDSYNLADSISVGSNTSWTVTSSRKYSGSYRIKYVMLTDDTKASSAGIKDYYECSYMGMANAYRDYLETTGVISRLTDDKVSEDMPLYIETFGSLKTTEKFLSFPVTVDTPLTTFEDIKTIYDELTEEGITNVDFRLTGYYNGGLDNTYPAKLKWVKALGGASGFKDLLSYADEKNFGVYPDFDFAYMKNNDWFDGVSQRRDLVKSIDDRYMSKREYDAAMQSFEADYALAMSPSVYEHFANKFNKHYSKYDAKGISLSTMGTDLNSDFDQDDPYNREDAKSFTTALLENLASDYSVMLSGGNAYSLKYADHLISVPTESSDFLKASESIPFVGLVLHGYINYSGSALNMEGDIASSVLKSIENGSSLYFTLCYRNTSALKESDEYNKYYSVSYDIWKNDMIEYYKTVNDALKDLQTQRITEHEFLSGVRILDDENKKDEELTPEEQEAIKKAEEEKAAETLREQNRAQLEASRGQTAAASSGNRTDDIDSNRNSASTYDDPDKYATESGSIVRVGYEGGTSFIINYNSYDVSVDYNGKTYTVSKLGFIKLDA